MIIIQVNICMIYSILHSILLFKNIKYIQITATVCGPIACTKEAKICPDGTVVSRDGNNNCEFTPCPEPCEYGSTAEGGCCNTVAGIVCDKGLECVDIPNDSCVLGKDSDCTGVCTSMFYKNI